MRKIIIDEVGDADAMAKGFGLAPDVLGGGRSTASEANAVKKSTDGPDGKAVLPPADPPANPTPIQNIPMACVRIMPDSRTLLQRLQINASGQAGVRIVNAVVAYEDVLAYHRAERAMAHWMADLGERFELRPRYWRFDALEIGKPAVGAFAEIIAADLVVVASASPYWPRGRVTRWLKTCLAAKVGGGAVIIAIHQDLDLDVAEPASITFVRYIAAGANMAVILVAESAAQTPIQRS